MDSWGQLAEAAPITLQCFSKRTCLNDAHFESLPILLCLSSTSPASRRLMFSSLVFEVIPSSFCPQNTLRIHPLLLEFVTAACAVEDNNVGHVLSNRDGASDFTTVRLESIPTTDASYWGDPDDHDVLLYRAQSVISVDLASDFVLVLECVYSDFETATMDSEMLVDILCTAIVGHFVQLQALLLLHTVEGYILCAVRELRSPEMTLHDRTVYRVGAEANVRLQLVPSTFSPVHPQIDSGMLLSSSCPGYEALLDNLLDLVQLTVSFPVVAPSGILLTGCAGVGKSWLASAVANTLTVSQSWAIHWVSCQELLLAAGQAREEDLLSILLPFRSEEHPTLVVIDDLHIFASEPSTEQALIDREQLLAVSCLVQAIDKLKDQHVPVIGIGLSSMNLLNELTKIGRLEKEVNMTTPTQTQRESILRHMLPEIVDDKTMVRNWASALASVTSGCVAADLRRLCTDAYTCARASSPKESKIIATWDILAQAARGLVPSQLALFDVTKAAVVEGEIGPEDWERIHNMCWSKVSGYALQKRRVYRSIVVPWRRYMSTEVQGEKALLSTISIPSGVLFYGPPGCGKTMAALCLGSSLSLPMINVRAANVLDKWLGGSEAAIRSLFSRARSAAPCILFFDEIDAIASNRGTDGESVDVMSRLLSTLLNELDGVNSEGQANVLVVACTNRIDDLDAALIRPGRLAEHICLLPPDENDAREILTQTLAKVPVDIHLDVEAWASRLSEAKFSCAQVEGLAREAVLRCLRRCNENSKIHVTSQDFDSAARALML